MQRMDVSIGFIRRGDTYILQQRSSDPRKGASGLIGAFGGQIENGETALEAVCRELREETSLKLSTEDFTYLGDVDVISDRNHKKIQIIARVFLVVIAAEETVVATEGKLVKMTEAEALQSKEVLTPATRAAFEQYIRGDYVPTN